MQRRYNNPLFPADRRVVTQQEVDAARARDAKDAAEFRVAVSRFFDSIIDLPDVASWQHCNEARKGLDSLLERAKELGGDLTAEQAKLSEIDACLLDTLRRGLTTRSECPEVSAEYAAEVLRGLDEAESFRSKAAIVLMDVFSRQLGRPDTPIQPAETVSALLSENPETIASFVEVLRITDEALAEQVRREALWIVTEAEAGGARLEGIDQKLRALGIAHRGPGDPDC